MAIEPNRLVVRTAYLQKPDLLAPVTPVCGPLDPIAPPNLFYDEGLAGYKTRLPEYVGQFCFVENNTIGKYNMYVAVNTSTPPAAAVLSWKRVAFYRLVLDPRTGKPYDPLAEFYNPLAT